jgi:hypothetical protein
LSITKEESLSATNIEIVFDGDAIGEIQSFSSSEDFALTAVNVVGSSYPKTFVPGVFRGSFQARKALIEPDLLFLKLTPMLSYEYVMHKLSKIISPSDGFIKSIDQILASTSSINDIINGIQKFVTGNDVSERSVLYNTMLFDIKIKDNFGDIIAIYKDSVLSTRNVTISTGNIIIFSDITGVYRRKL